jgi:hypothetical protein
MSVFCELFQESEYPVVTMAIFIEQPTPFFEEFLVNIVNLVYPKDKIDLFIHNSVSTISTKPNQE